MEVKDEIIKYCEENVTLYGFADISEYKDEIVSEDLKEYDYAICLGIKLPDGVVDDLDSREGKLAYLNAYTGINNKLNDISLNIESLLKDNGYDARAVNASYILPDGRLTGEVSHKFIANLAGLGWIGKSCLLITENYGPRLRWVSVLTNMEVTGKNNRLKSKCNDCDLCVKSCPVSAFTGIEFNECEPREIRYDAEKCNDYFEYLEAQTNVRLCGICVKVCPWGLNPQWK